MSRIIENPKQLILTKAKEILYNQGYGKLSMRGLSKACDIALVTINNYYPTKKDLIIEMMTDYWQNYLDSVKNIVNSDTDIKLNNIFIKLEVFIQNFGQYWLTPDLYESHEYVEGGLHKEHVFIEKLIYMVEDILIKENIQIKLGTR